MSKIQSAQKTSGQFNKENRRRKQILLPVTGRVPLYILSGSGEEASTLEFEYSEGQARWRPE